MKYEKFGGFQYTVGKVLKIPFQQCIKNINLKKKIAIANKKEKFVVVLA
jgi:hypothetical protein